MIRSMQTHNTDQITCNLAYIQRLDNVIVIDCMHLMKKKKIHLLTIKS